MMICNSVKIFVLMKAISIVESGGDPTAVGDNGDAFGHMQIHAGVVQDVNETYGTTYTHDQMFDYDVSCTVFWLWQKRYVRALSVNHGRQADIEICARFWNGGYSNLINHPEYTDKYWAKVKPIYEDLLIKSTEE